LEDAVPLSHRPSVLAALVVVVLAAVVAVAGARDSGSPPRPTLQTEDDGSRNAAAEAATGDTEAMLAVAQDIVDCLRSRGFQPGEARVEGGTNVVIADWDPVWDSPAGAADRACAFPVR
jgi:hypothetical protein